MTAVAFRLGAFPPAMLHGLAMLPLIGLATAAIARFAGLLKVRAALPFADHARVANRFAYHQTAFHDPQIG